MINKKIRLIELFGGVGCQALALRDLAIASNLRPEDVFEHYRLVEFDKYPVKSYNAVHGTNFVPMDITEIKGEDLGIVDKDKYTYICTYSFPCFTGDTLVLTTDGYKEIKNINIGDMVLSHDNKYHIVTDSKSTGEKNIYCVRGMGIDEIKCTENHKFYVRKMVRHMPVGQDGKRHKIREFLAPEWKECKDLDKSYYLGVAINQNNTLPNWDGIIFRWSDGRKDRSKNQITEIINKHSFWWIVGRYLGDGWLRQQGGIIICCAVSELTEITPHLRNLSINYSVAKEDNIYKIHIPQKEFGEFMSLFGSGAINKHLPGFIFDLPQEYCQSLVDGYCSADGCYTENRYKISSISRELIYGMAQIIAKAYNVPYSIYFTNRPQKYTILGRKVNQHNTYQLCWKLNKTKQDKAFYEDGFVWFPLTSIENMGKTENVYDITVDNSHSFTANGVIVHNCQDLSVAGKQAGMDKGSGTRSGLLWEVERLLNETNELPDILLMENVTQVHGKKNFDNFNKWIDFLESKGYHNYWQDLEASQYCIPQHRNRTFMVSSLEDIDYVFPRTIELKKVMRDMLDETVDEKYYINNEKAQTLIEKLIEDGKLDEESVLAS